LSCYKERQNRAGEKRVLPAFEEMLRSSFGIHGDKFEVTPAAHIVPHVKTTERDQSLVDAEPSCRCLPLASFCSASGRIRPPRVESGGDGHEDMNAMGHPNKHDG